MNPTMWALKSSGSHKIVILRDVRGMRVVVHKLRGYDNYEKKNNIASAEGHRSKS